MDKLTSRKFWMCVAAFLASVATSIAGIKSDNQTVIIIGIVCGILSTAIYAFCEAWVDAASCKYDYLGSLLNSVSNELDDEDEDNE